MHIEILDSERAAVRLGHNAFTRRVLSETRFRERRAPSAISAIAWTSHHVGAYRAVATAAAREARNYRRLMERIAAQIRNRTRSDQQRGRSAPGLLRRAVDAGRPRASPR